MKRLSVFVAVCLVFGSPLRGQTTRILNVSYDPTREFYEQFDASFVKAYQAKTGKTVAIEQSHGGSGKQARAVIDGLEADVVTLGLPADIDSIHEHGDLLAADWEQRFPNHSVPYTSTVNFLVRKGNPKGIKDWADLTRAGIVPITPNPKTSSGGRWNFLAAWGYALKANHNDETKAQEYVTALYKKVPVLDSGARGSTVTFTQRRLGDVLIAWENEAYLSLKEFGANQFEVINPKVSILAEPPVAIVDKNVDKRGTRQIATDYLQYLYSAEGQDIAAQNFYRPIDPEIEKKYAARFPEVERFTVAEVFGGWKAAQAKFFADGGIFDKIYSR